MPNIERPRQALRIPGGWMVEHNDLFETEPSFSTFEDISWDFGEDILLLSNKNRGLVISLGWLPAHNEVGAFQLLEVQLCEDSEKMPDAWSAPLKQFISRSKSDVVGTLEEWLMD
jgi:hypothetical protein